MAICAYRLLLCVTSSISVSTLESSGNSSDQCIEIIFRALEHCVQERPLLMTAFTNNSEGCVTFLNVMLHATPKNHLHLSHIQRFVFQVIFLYIA